MQLATKTDLLGIISLWQEAFGDSPEAVSYFFKSFPHCVSYVTEDGGEIVSMVHALPQVLSPDTPAALPAVCWRRRSWGCSTTMKGWATKPPSPGGG